MIINNENHQKGKEGIPQKSNRYLHASYGSFIDC